MDNNIELNLQKIVDGHHRVTYRGIKMIKNPFDYLLYQMLINEVQPDLIVEIGTNHGGATLYMADMLDIIGKGEIHTVDITEYPMDEKVLNNKRIKRFLGGYQSYDLKNCEGFEKILVIDDGSHVYEHSLEIMNKFKNIVTVGSYFIIEDGALIHIGLTKDYGGGPVKAIEEFLQENPNYQIDRSYCDFFGKNATFNTNGFIKRLS
jgi:cephalosporin hydroxylase